MWDNAALLRTIANALITFSVLASLYGAIHYVVHRPGLLPLHSVRLDASPERIDASGVLQIVRNEVRGNFFTVDIERLRASLEKLPWVRSVNIRREFPDRLTVQFEEHRAAARWNKAALVNDYGEVFLAETTQKLPQFIGQDGTSLEVMQYYAQFSQQLTSLNLRLSQIALSPRHAWQLHLSNGLILELGREDMEQRLGQFIEAYPSIASRIQQGEERNTVKYVDLRYRNGFAVRS